MDVPLDRALAELASAVPELLDRSLYYAARWASELLLSSGAGVVPGGEAGPRVDDREAAAVGLAKSFVGLRQHRRAANALTGCTTPLAVFIRAYSRFLAGEKRKEDEGLEQGSTSRLVNEELSGLDAELSDAYTSGALDGFGLYMYGIVLKSLQRFEQARRALVESVNVYPWNWSAWKALASLVTDMSMVRTLELREHWMLYFFRVEVGIELHDGESAMAAINVVKPCFPQSLYILSQTAMVHYNERDFDAAQEIFEEIRETDPDRLDQMDTYSNILFVKESKGALSYLAHNAVQSEKYCPETCCIIGNYYSLKCEHEKAVLYFQRALKLNPQYLSAWTLMGHEYIELHNTAAAISAYRQAVDINPKDYRAWYGLGQAYELLQMHTYSLYYFGKAVHVRPFDPRMWCALANSYERLEMIDDAIRCCKRAESCNDREGIALYKLAKLYVAKNDMKKAAHFYGKVVERHDAQSGENAETAEIIDALMFLAQYYKDCAAFTEAEACCARLLHTTGADDARAMQKELHQLRLKRDFSPRENQDYDMSMSP